MFINQENLQATKTMKQKVKQQETTQKINNKKNLNNKQA